MRTGEQRKIPNPLTAFRLLALPALWLLAVLDQQRWLAVGVALAALSDVLDGRLAKRDPRFADGRFDSLADKFLTVSVIAWLVLLKGELLLDHRVVVATAAATFSTSLLLGRLRHRRLTSLHTHLGKAGGVAQGLFVVHAFWTHGHNLPLFYLAIGLFIVASLEEIWIQWVYDELDEEVVRSIVPYLLGDRSGI